MYDSMRHLDDFDPDDEDEEEKTKVPKKVNDARNIKIDETVREVDLPAGKTMAQIVEGVSKMNKKDRAKVLERSRQPEQGRKTKDPPRNQEGGSRGSGIPRDPVTGRAL